MVRLNIKVQKCVRKGGESSEQYINLVKAPALAYLHLTRKRQDFSESQVISMTVIVNAKLPAQIFQTRSAA